MRSLKAEQAAVIKFLTLEGSTHTEIFQRLKNVFSSFTLPKEKVYKLHLRFLREGLLGLKEEPPYEEECSGSPLNDEGLKEEPIYEEECSGSPLNDKSFVDTNGLQDIKLTFLSRTDSTNLKEEENQFKELEDEEEEIDHRTRYKGSKRVKEIRQKASKRKRNDTSEEYDFDRENFTTQHHEDDSECDSLAKNNSPEGNDKDELTSRALSHPSIFKSDIEALSSISRTQLNCPLCIRLKFNIPSMLKRHFLRLHINHKIVVGPFISLICRCGCVDSEYLRSHYHCPLCPYVSQKLRVVLHFNQHLSHSNYKRFKTILESSDKPRSISIDSRAGLYLVPKTVNEPTHVIQKTVNGKSVDKCSEELCEAAMQKSRNNGILHLKCKHILRAADAVQYTDNTSIFTDILKSQCLRIGDQEKHMCFYLINQALSQKVPPVVEWLPESRENIVFYSVFCDSSYSSFGRIIVKYDAKMDSFQCDCPFLGDNDMCPYARLCFLYVQFRDRASESQDLVENTGRKAAV